jgi:hypothetical protein
MRRRVREEGAVLVLFNTIFGQQAFLPPEEELTQGFVEVFRSGDGAAYAGTSSEGGSVIQVRGSQW